MTFIFLLQVFVPISDQSVCVRVCVCACVCVCVCVCAWQGQTGSEEREKSRQRQTGKLTELDSFVYLFPLLAEQRPCRFFFFPHKKISCKRWRNTPPDYSAYSCCDALFIVSLAALLDWHSSLEYFTLFIDQLLPFECRHAKSTAGRSPLFFTLTRRTKKKKKRHQKTSILRHKQLELSDWPAEDKVTAVFSYQAYSGLQSLLLGSPVTHSLMLLGVCGTILVWHHPYFMVHHLDSHAAPLVYVNADTSICHSTQYCYD